MKELLADYAIKALAWLESGVAFIQGELPLYIEELIKWNLTENIIYMVIFLLVTIGCTILSVKFYKGLKTKDISSDRELGCFMGSFFSIVGSISFFFGGVVSHIPETIQLLIAPRVWLIDYLADFIQ